MLEAPLQATAFSLHCPFPFITMASFTLRCSGVLALVATGLLWPQGLRAEALVPEPFSSSTARSQSIAREPAVPKATSKNLSPESANAPQQPAPVAREILLQVQGTLAEGDRVFQDGSLYVPHTLEGKAGDLIQIRLESTDFDTYLILQGPDGSQVAQNDDLLGTNSWIAIELPETGRYQILANSYDASGRGDYQLTVRTATRRDLTITATVTRANGLFQQGFQQYQRSQYQAALASWEQALDFYTSDTVRAIFPLESYRAQGMLLGNIGLVYDDLGDYEQAIALYRQSLTIAREFNDQAEEGRALGNIGVAYLSLSDYEQAADFFEQQRFLAIEVGDRDSEGRALNNLGLVYMTSGDYDQAITLLEQYIAIAQETGYRLGEGYALGNLGDIYNALGQYERAIALQLEFLSISREIDNRFGEASALNSLGISYYFLGDLDRVIDLFEQSIAILEAVESPASASVIGDLGVIYQDLGDYDQALALHQQHLDIAQAIGSRSEEARALNNLGVAYSSLGDYETALELYQQSLAIFREVGAKVREGIALARLGQLLADQDQPELAIVFLKASVDVQEAIRGNISGLDVEIQQSFVNTVADDYRLLADLLLQENRIIEAQRILDLLKVQELDDYLQDVQRSAQTETGVEFWRPEETILALYEEVLLTGTELTQLQARDPNRLSAAEQARLAELTTRQNQLYTSFIDWLEHPDILASLDQLRADTRSRTVDIENFTDLQQQLAQLPQSTVILYPLILADRLELVLVSADAPPVRYPVPVDALTLNRTIVAFGQALKQPGSNVEPLAQQLYDWVIAPLESDLAALDVESIIFAPDGALRYVPLAALYDGDQWLIERFSFSQITAASETDFAAAPSDRRSLLAAACAACSFTVEVGDSAFDFEDLPATRDEVDGLATQIPEASVLVDSEFTPAAFAERLGSYNLIHLATHGMFVSGDPDASFLLFGNGQSVNLRQIRRQWQQMDADLIVLSACETALGSAELGNGIEVLGLGFQLQRVGARAVMASLWQVSDRGTQVLMTAFYAALNQGMTKADALREAQLALINSSDGPGEAGDRGIGVVGNPTNASGTTRAVGYSHPYYWAPFILIGNGL
jgi:CHAT domain-containing protein/tetratricopeptide (TPR) repeat protein